MKSKENKAAIKAAWMATYEKIVVAGIPEAAGQIDWDTANWLYYSGLTAEESAKRIVDGNNE